MEQVGDQTFYMQFNRCQASKVDFLEMQENGWKNRLIE